MDPVTPEELARRCDWVYRRARRIVETTGKVKTECYFGKGPGPVLRRLDHPLVGEIMNDGDHKARFFALIRRLMEQDHYDCSIFMLDTWLFEANERHEKLTEAQRDALMDRGFKTLAERGYGVRTEALIINGQTPHAQYHIKATYVRKKSRIRFDPVETLSNGVMGGGRLMMWGEWHDPQMTSMYKGLKDFAQHFSLEDLTREINIAAETP